VVVSHLVAYYQSTELQFSLALVITGASKEVEDAAKEDPEVNTAIARMSPGFGKVRFLGSALHCLHCAEISRLPIFLFC
jgi:hypothetical protein